MVLPRAGIRSSRTVEDQNSKQERKMIRKLDAILKRLEEARLIHERDYFVSFWDDFYCTQITVTNIIPADRLAL